MYEMDNYLKTGISNEELDFMKNSITQSDALRYETNFQKANFLSRLIEFELPKDYIRQQNTLIKNLTKEEINAIAKQVLEPEKMTILVVGDKDKIKAPLEKSGYKIVDYKDVEVATSERK
jgi:zinc protease